MFSELCSFLSPLKYQQSWVGENDSSKTDWSGTRTAQKEANFTSNTLFSFWPEDIRVQLQTGILWTPVSSNSSCPHGQLPEPLKTLVWQLFRWSLGSPNVKNVSNPESHLLLTEKSMSESPLAPPTTADYADWSAKEQLEWLLFEGGEKKWRNITKQIDSQLRSPANASEC